MILRTHPHQRLDLVGFTHNVSIFLYFVFLAASCIRGLPEVNGAALTTFTSTISFTTPFSTKTLPTTSTDTATATADASTSVMTTRSTENTTATLPAGATSALSTVSTSIRTLSGSTSVISKTTPSFTTTSSVSSSASSAPTTTTTSNPSTSPTVAVAAGTSDYAEIYATLDSSSGILHALVNFTNVVREASSTVLVTVQGITGFTLAAGPYMFHIHQFAVPANGDCGATGPHYNPTYVTPGTEIPGNFSSYEVGDLSGKYGKLNGSIDGSTTIFSITDSTLNLKQITGLSVVFHNALGARIACGNIVDAATFSSATTTTTTATATSTVTSVDATTSATNSSPSPRSSVPALHPPSPATSAAGSLKRNNVSSGMMMVVGLTTAAAIMVAPSVFMF